jgi:hypothetical protein
LVPFSTYEKWSKLRDRTRKLLLEKSCDNLTRIISFSNIDFLLANGEGVIRILSDYWNLKFERAEVPDWELRRLNGRNVKGFSYSLDLKEICGVKTNRIIKIVGYSHNLQSSFGVTKEIRSNIRNWVRLKNREVQYA